MTGVNSLTPNPRTELVTEECTERLRRIWEENILLDDLTRLAGESLKDWMGYVCLTVAFLVDVEW